MSALDPTSAMQDFHRARDRAVLEDILARLTGTSADLLCYDEIRQKLRPLQRVQNELQEIPLDAVVGSVGRCTDFTRSFLPRHDELKYRWAQVKRAMTGMSGVPPIEVYQVGQVYFVRDGHHRVSVARQLGFETIQAYVTPVPIRVPLTPNLQPDELIVKIEYAEFLEITHLDELRPDADLSVSVPGQYDHLYEHIAVHRYFMGLEQEQEIPYHEAVTHWYDHVYLPVVEVIRQRAILREFPERTEADLYLWVTRHRSAVERELGWRIAPRAAAGDVAVHFSPRPRRRAARVEGRVRRAVVPTAVEGGPEPGTWRREIEQRREERMFAEIMVAVNGREDGWQALEQALALARREGAQLLGLHVVRSEDEKASPEARTVRETFEQRCQTAGVPGALALEVGEVARKVCERAWWADLVVASLAYPPPPHPLARLSSGFGALIRTCPRPVLAVPQATLHMERALLAYDGSPKADEALFVATYLSARWPLFLAVAVVDERGVAAENVLGRARDYLETHGVQAAYVVLDGDPAGAIVKANVDHAGDLILMGGYGSRPVLEIALGSTVDRVLREARKPVLICR